MRSLRTKMILGVSALVIGAGVLAGGAAQAAQAGTQTVAPAAPVPAGATIVDGGVLEGGPSAAELAQWATGPAIEVEAPAAGPGVTFGKTS